MIQEWERQERQKPRMTHSSLVNNLKRPSRKQVISDPIWLQAHVNNCFSFPLLFLSAFSWMRLCYLWHIILSAAYAGVCTSAVGTCLLTHPAPLTTFADVEDDVSISLSLSLSHFPPLSSPPSPLLPLPLSPVLYQFPSTTTLSAS